MRAQLWIYLLQYKNTENKNLLWAPLLRLMETMELLQAQVEELQHQVQELKLSPRGPLKPSHREAWPPRGALSVSCLKELQSTLR